MTSIRPGNWRFSAAVVVDARRPPIDVRSTRSPVVPDTPLPQLADAVRAAARGETVLASPVAAKLVPRMRAPTVEAPAARELEVLGGVARGLTNAEIGRELFIGEATVNTHLLRVFAKLGVDDRTRAVLTAVERGLLPGPGGS